MAELNHDTVDEAPRDAASVVLVRDSANGLEAFLLKRSGSKTVVGDAYVFPGGKVDDADSEPVQNGSLKLAGDPGQLIGEVDSARAGALFVAACRETEEETGVRLDPSALVPLSRWITPKTPAMMRRRFDTRFFVALMPADQTAVHDGQEAKDSTWMSARDALQAYHDKKINLAPPQIMTLAGISQHRTFADLAQSLQGQTPRLIEPVSFKQGDGRIIVYPGHPRHPVSERAMPGPSSLVWNDGRFESVDGFDGYFTDS